MSNRSQGLLSHFHLGFVTMLCAYMRPTYQVSVYRTIGHLVFNYGPTSDDDHYMTPGVHKRNRSMLS